MKNGILVLFEEEGKVKQLKNIEEAIMMAEEFNKNSTEKYCKDYNLEYDTLSKSEASIASGYENGILKLFNTNDVIKEIKHSDMLKEEKEFLLDRLENSCESINIEDYDSLDSILETCNEINISDYYNIL